MGKPEKPNIIRVRPYPKVIFFYPTVILAGIYCLLALFGVVTENEQGLNLLFMAIFSVNVLVFAFDFSILMTIIIGVVVVLGGVALWLWNALSEGAVFGGIAGFIGSIVLGMNSHFYFYYFIFFLIVYLLVFIRTRFNYWDIRHNELFHKHGLLADTQRINAPNLSYTREINDVFEYLLLRGGRLKLIPQNHEPFVIETVLNIKKVDKRLGEILSKMKVTFDQGTGAV